VHTAIGAPRGRQVYSLLKGARRQLLSLDNAAHVDRRAAHMIDRLLDNQDHIGDLVD
jgi:hypothetical protein